MKRNNKKGFTIVELVIVIAVIAILAGVLIPTFASIVRKANLSADQQAVRQMNTILSTYDADGSIKTVADAVAVLDKENIELDNYKPLTKDHYFYFVLDENGNGRIILADGDDNIIYPEKIDLAANAQWMSLSGMVPMDDDYKVANDGTVTLNSGAKLAHLMEAVKNNKEDVTTVTLSGNIDLKGAAVDFGVTNTDITIKGENGTTLSGLRADDNTVSPATGEFAGHSYGFGLFGDIQSGTVTVENITISGLVVGNSLGDHEQGANTIGLIAGYVQEGAFLVMKNVTIADCTVNGYQKVGGIVGQLKGTLTMDNVKVTNTTVNGYTEVAKVAGVAFNTANLTATNCDFSGVTVKCLNANQIKRSDVTSSEVALVGPDANTYVLENDKMWIFGGATNEYAWYYTGNYFDVTTASGTYEGTRFMSSTSKNITAGTPAN